MNRILISGLLLACACLWPSPAIAQDADAVLARADKINKFLALLSHEDESVRVAALEQGLKSDDRILRARTIDAGLTAADPELKNMAMVKHLSSKPLMMLESPETLSLSDSKALWAEENLPAQFTLYEDNEWSSKSFEMFLRFLNGSYSRLDCSITAGRVLCTADQIKLTMEPSEGGIFVGTISTRKVSNMPFVYRYK